MLKWLLKSGNVPLALLNITSNSLNPSLKHQSLPKYYFGEFQCRLKKIPNCIFSVIKDFEQSLIPV